MGGRSSRWKRWIWAAAKLALVGAVVASAVYWVRFSPILVEAHRTDTGVVIAEVMGTGTLQPRVRASVGARITGRLAAVLADQSDRVKAGQLVATLDDSDLRQQVEVAKAELSLARAGVDRAAAAIVRAQANAVQARASYSRVEALGKRIVSEEDLDKSAQQRAVAEADLSLADSRRWRVSGRSSRQRRACATTRNASRTRGSSLPSTASSCGATANQAT